jgi:hypothetical protein
MASGKAFEAQVRKWAKSFPDKLDALLRQSAFQLSENVVNATPVDTGYLRSAWQPSIGEPKTSAGTGADPVTEIGLVTAQFKAGEKFYLTNGTYYGPFVEYGTSRMAPRYFVSDQVKRWPYVAAQVAKELGLK